MFDLDCDVGGFFGFLIIFIPPLRVITLVVFFCGEMGAVETPAPLLSMEANIPSHRQVHVMDQEGILHETVSLASRLELENLGLAFPSRRGIPDGHRLFDG